MGNVKATQQTQHISAFNKDGRFSAFMQAPTLFINTKECLMMSD